MNMVVLVGRLTRDPEVRDTATETALTVLRLAIPQGRDADEAVYVDVVCFGRQAVSAAAFLSKGRLVAVTGRLGHQEWTAPDGRRRSRHEVVAQAVDYLDSPARAETPAVSPGR
jgi:single-strand DNA-binding protein